VSKNITTVLKTFLRNNRYPVIADLYDFTFVDGLALRLTSFACDVFWGGKRYSSMGPRLTRGEIKLLQGIEVSDLDVTIAADAFDLANCGLTYQSAAVAGLWDGANVTLNRAFFADPPLLGADMRPDGTFDVDLGGRGVVNLFVGRVGELDIDSLQVKMVLHSLTELLNIQMPRMLYQPNCRFALYDAGCDLERADFAVTGTVQQGSTASTIFVPDMLIPATAPGAGGALPIGWLGLGSITMTSGKLAGVSRTIAQFIPSGLQDYQRAILADGPVGYWRLGTNANDSSGGGHNGTNFGATFGAGGLLVGDSAASCSFNGTSSYIDLPVVAPYDAWNGGGGASLEMWVKPTLAFMVGAFDTSSGSVGGVANLDYGSGLGGIVVGPGKNPWIRPLSFSTGVPSHLAVTLSGALNVAIYINGLLAAASQASRNRPNFGPGAMQIGHAGTVWSHTQFFSGLIQDVAIYPYALSDAQVATHYAIGTTVPPNVPVAYVILMQPFPFAPSPGDSFIAYAGCALDLRTCEVKFNNILNFGGTPAIPQPQVTPVSQA
jgi:hypothetical protein